MMGKDSRGRRRRPTARMRWTTNFFSGRTVEIKCGCSGNLPSSQLGSLATSNSHSSARSWHPKSCHSTALSTDRNEKIKLRVLRLQCKTQQARQTVDVVCGFPGGANQESRKRGKITIRRRGVNDEHVGAFRARAAWASPTCIRGFLKRVVWLIPVARDAKRGHTEVAVRSSLTVDRLLQIKLTN